MSSPPLPPPPPPTGPSPAVSGHLTFPRRTLAAAAAAQGPGLFDPRFCHLQINPAPAGTGIVFRRIDLPGAPEVPAAVDRVVHEPRRTVLAGKSGAPTVQTVEHLLSALAAFGVTDAVIELDAPEPPLGDGSSREFAEAVAAAGVVQLDSAIAPLVISRPVEIGRSGGGGGGGGGLKAAPLAPGDPPGSLILTYELDYGPGAPIPPQRATWVMEPGAAPDAYRRELAPARTFATADEAVAMRNMGLFRHLAPGDVLVVGPDGPIGTGYRFPDEPARHKIVDLIGDLSLIGRPIVGRVTATKTGHADNHALTRALIAAHPS